MPRKTDPVNGEQFDCEPDGPCWCKDLPPILPVAGTECIGPTRLNDLKDQPNERTDGC